MRFSGKTAVVSGGGGGMGSEISSAFARQGAEVAVLDIDLPRARLVSDRIVESGGKSAAFKVDASNYLETDAVIGKVITAFGHIDILVNAVGVSGEMQPVSALTEEAWDRSIAINLKGVFNPTKAVINHMIERRYGKIIFISSVSGMVGTANMSPYSTAKAAIFGFSKSLAKEVAGLGINVNVIAPGPVTTPFNDMVGQEFHKKVLEQTPVGRAGTAREIAALTLFLASEDANFIVGQVISPNGGRFM